ncbi:MoaD/ThiS family protein [Sphingobacterium faecium]|uniref:MoaD/ThiS family protein n=1 Tax=Sphingobacterium faecium TaxID=34087 RepID=UPI0024691D11|nr:MoaD/ThiS family protein [Sphingobacterium faecium]MDH5827011.1 MoaD/ThiS family protein [Sphingobacterium faecium]
MMIKVLTFGKISELLGPEFSANATDTDNLIASLMEKHKTLNNQTVLIAVNNAIVQHNTPLKEHDIVALMPPYSGG